MGILELKPLELHENLPQTQDMEAFSGPQCLVSKMGANRPNF